MASCKFKKKKTFLSHSFEIRLMGYVCLLLHPESSQSPLPAVFLLVQLLERKVSTFCFIAGIFHQVHCFCHYLAAKRKAYFLTGSYEDKK